jgi:hypothetical protein
MLDGRLKPLPSTRDSRRADRFPLKIAAMLREPGSTKFSVDVRDLSVTGFRCETSFSIEIGKRVWLTLPGMAPLEALVMWHDKYVYGFAFTAPLHPAVLDHLAKQERRSRPRG